ncbi:MAG: class D beta-lactamase [Richelia sp. RM2_1_2]|nr:class D beta-lactamase [Richelia sp. SM1_7_0]NJN07170.1 class D beta-lactamase [Richelia sp. RM1_1_1]NJO29108.1 class D beta-lactamase [Richelia sp. SL_2_1]NJO57861.1 class D beta-lactamase [Richelia sp. RM2_1_2]
MALSYFLQKVCGIGFVVLIFFPIVATPLDTEDNRLNNRRDKAVRCGGSLRCSNCRAESAEEREYKEVISIRRNIQSSKAQSKINFESVFKELGIEGSIVIYDARNKKFYEHNAARNSTVFFPASTYKILNTLIALETAVIHDDVTVLTWDGIKRDIDVWNQDTNLRQAFKNSTVWFYQVLARKIGNERMQSFINKIGYGNQQIGTAENIDKFWLEGPLQITPKQQIELLKKVYDGKLPFSQRNLNLLKDMMIVEQTPDYTLRGKTGWVTSTNPKIGWFVGYLEQNNKVYYFATNIDMPNVKLAPARIKVTRRCLQMLGLF